MYINKVFYILVQIHVNLCKLVKDMGATVNFLDNCDTTANIHIDDGQLTTVHHYQVPSKPPFTQTYLFSSNHTD